MTGGKVMRLCCLNTCSADIHLPLVTEKWWKKLPAGSFSVSAGFFCGTASDMRHNRSTEKNHRHQITKTMPQPPRLSVEHWGIPHKRGFNDRLHQSSSGKKHEPYTGSHQKQQKTKTPEHKIRICAGGDRLKPGGSQPRAQPKSDCPFL